MTVAAIDSPTFLSRERTIARAGFNRWLVPPAALAIHLCIGMAYGFSVFWTPLEKAIGISKPLACPAEMTFVESLFAASCDWKRSMLIPMFTLFFVLLGSSAAIWGGWLERAGPRKAGLVAAFCWCGGLVISAAGVYLHQIWMLWVGSGVIGGIGLGLGYISPVSTLIKWFPDRRGMATGMAIMGFGGGAMIGGPLATMLIQYYATPKSVGVWETFLTLAAIYFVFMVGGAFGYRVPREGWKPHGWTPPATNGNSMITSRHVHLSVATWTPQFALLWLVLMLNVSAGIGLIGVASPMLQEIFGGQLIGVDGLYSKLTKEQLALTALIGGGFVGLISLLNIGGRFFWATMSDYLGRKLTYVVFFVLGCGLYASMATSAHAGSMLLFVLAFCVIASMYGGGFATIPAYLADMFGTHMVGAIHGRLLTAWSTAGIVGPVIVSYLYDSQKTAGVPVEAIYDRIFYIMAGLLVLGFISNLLIRPVAGRHFMTDEQIAADKKLAATKENGGVHADFEDFTEEAKGPGGASGAALRSSAGGTGGGVTTILAWLIVGVPLAWGIWITLQKASVLFH